MFSATRVQTRPAFPAIGEIFELTTRVELSGPGLISYLNYNRLELERFGYSSTKYRFTGNNVPANTTRKFKLIVAGEQNNLYDVVRVCKARGGRFVEGMWVTIFDEIFYHNWVNCVGVPDASWMGPNDLEGPGDYAHFPVVTQHGERMLRPANERRSDIWLWLVGA